MRFFPPREPSRELSIPMPRRLPLSLSARLWLVVASLLSMPALAEKSNLVENSLFNDDLSAWTAVGSWSHEAGDGSPFGGLGSAEVVSSGAGLLSLTQCVDVSGLDAGRTLTLAGFARAVDHTSPITVAADVFSDAGCSAPMGITASNGSSAPLDTWSGYYVPIPLPAGAGSFLVRLEVVAGGAGETTRFDDAALRRDLIIGGDFTSDLGSWVQTPPGSWTLSADGVSMPFGSAEGTVSADGSVFLSQCLRLEDAPPTAHLLAWALVKALDELADYQLSYQFWDNTSCAPPGNFLGAQGLLTRPNSVGTWSFFFRTVAVPPQARSVAVFVALNPGAGTPGTRFRVDNVVLQASDSIFLDGFESGDLSAWSSTVP